jgi:hypothetical protein
MNHTLPAPPCMLMVSGDSSASYTLHALHHLIAGSSRGSSRQPPPSWNLAIPPQHLLSICMSHDRDVIYTKNQLLVRLIFLAVFRLSFSF